MSRQIRKLQQNAGELYFTLRAQQELERLERSISKRSRILKQEFESYLKSSGLSFESFKVSEYYLNVDKHVKQIVLNWIKSFNEGMRADIQNYMQQGRADQTKTDFIIILSNGRTLNYSLKNYSDKQISDIQVGSGTWASVLLNFLFPSVGIGSWIYQGKKFTSKDHGQNRLKVRDAIANWCHINNVAADPLFDAFNGAVERNSYIKHKYVENSSTEYLTEDVQKSFEQDCFKHGHAQIDDMLNALAAIPQDFIRRRFQEMIGLDGEELLCLWGEEFIDSLNNKRFKSLTSRINNDNIVIKFMKHSKNIRLIAIDTKGEILAIDIPFTYNKNGAWHDENYPRFCSKSKKIIQPLQRRPGKAKEMNTSTNTWVRLKSALST